MRRKLVGYDVFNQIQKESLSNAISEIRSAEEIVANLLEVDSVTLHSFDENQVYFAADNGDFIRANYDVDGTDVVLSNIEQIVINEESHEAARKQIVAEMLDCVYGKDTLKAKSHFQRYLEMIAPKMKFIKEHLTEDAKIQGIGAKDPKKSLAAKKGHRNNPVAAKKGWQKRKKNKIAEERRHNSPTWLAAKRRVEQAKKTGNKNARIAGVRNESVNNWVGVAKNVLEYVDFISASPIKNQFHLEHDDAGNIVTIKLPSTELRLEGKLLSYKYDSLKSDVKVLREKGAKTVSENEFKKAVVELKSLNNLASNNELEESISSLVANHPTLIYLTQDELSESIANALESSGAKNWDDQMCKFMAEGILRTAMFSYPERINKLVHLAQIKVNEGENDYEKIQEGLKSFFKEVDEKMHVESQVFEDLHTVMSEVRRYAHAIDSEVIRHHAVDYLNQLESVLSGKAKPSLTLAEEVSAYLALLFEVNLSGINTWKVDKTPHNSDNGEHPDLFKAAKQSYSPAADLDAGTENPVSDGKSLKFSSELKDHGWANVGDQDTYPTLNNPYIPKSDKKWTMKGEKGVDVDANNGLGQNQSSDTWPNLDNPYLPQSIKFHVNDEEKVDDVEVKGSLKVN